MRATRTASTQAIGGSPTAGRAAWPAAAPLVENTTASAARGRDTLRTPQC